jgi:hypothetical protein
MPRRRLPTGAPAPASDDMGAPRPGASAAESAAATPAEPPLSNKVCFDCNQPHEGTEPWASVTYGVTLCLGCAGVHRSLGVHVSFVRSLTLDTLSDREKRAMDIGGNAAFAAFLADPSRGVSRRVWLALPLQTRYFTPAADLYRRRQRTRLDAEEEAISARALPAELDTAIRPPVPSDPSQQAMGGEGGGGGGGGLFAMPTWTADNEAPRCELCKADFHLFNWRHHCRKCGRCVCGECSPVASWRPLPELFGNSEAQRCCKLCFTPTQPMVGMEGAPRPW